MRSTGLFIILVFSGFFLFPEKNLLSQCASGSVTLNGFDSNGGQGTYEDPATGKIKIQYCIDLQKFFEVNTNWVHGIFVSWDNLPKGAMICEGPTGSQPAQHGSRFWIFLDSAKARNYFLPGPGFYVDEGDGNPVNNYGDNGLGTPQATFPDLLDFCFVAKFDCSVSAPTAYVPKITITGDGSTGAWENPACPGDIMRAEDGGPNGNGAVVVCGAVLPVKLLTFNGESTKQGNLIKWLAVSDRFFSHFELQGSNTNVASFKMLGTIDPINANTGTGNEIADYSFLDTNPTLVNYYRLKMIEKDGTFEYSKIISIQQKSNTKISNRFSVFPNPASDLLIIHNETENKYGDVQLNIYDIYGKKVNTYLFTLDKPEKDLYFDVSNYAKGFYFLEISAGDNTIEKLNFIKN